MDCSNEFVKCHSESVFHLCLSVAYDGFRWNSSGGCSQSCFSQSVCWKTIVVLVLLTILSYVFDFLGSYFGAKYFGATKWGAFGAILGALIGLFFGILGLFVGPVVGAIAGEFIAGKQMIDAGRAGWGSLLGNIGGMLAKLIIALTMIAIFLVNVPSPF